MKYILSRIFALILLFTPFTNANLFAKEKNKVVNKTVKSEKSLLWKISGNGLTEASYLFGTIHIICKDDFFWSDAMENALSNSKKVTFELDLDDPTMQMQMVKALMATDGKNLQDYFTPEEYEAFKIFATTNMTMMPLEMMNRLSPSGVLMMMSTSMFKCEQTASYEMSISEKATADKKEILGLETLDAQIKAINSLPVDSTIKTINKMVRESENGDIDKQFVEMIKVYKDQDIEGLHTVMNMEGGMKMDTEEMLDKRNKNWIPEIEKMIKEQSTFIAVGAAHLGGKNGVINLLKKQGYKIEAIK